MKWLISGRWAIVIGMLCIPRMTVANGGAAADGRISFAGAVVESTCPASAVTIGAIAAKPASYNATRHRFGCGNAGIANDSGRLYSLTVVNLDATTINHDRVLEYFAGYLKAAGNDEGVAKLVTQSFD